MKTTKLFQCYFNFSYKAINGTLCVRWNYKLTETVLLGNYVIGKILRASKQKGVIWYLEIVVLVAFG